MLSNNVSFVELSRPLTQQAQSNKHQQSVFKNRFALARQTQKD